MKGCTIGVHEVTYLLKTW